MNGSLDDGNGIFDSHVLFGAVNQPAKVMWQRMRSILFLLISILLYSAVLVLFLVTQLQTAASGQEAPAVEAADQSELTWWKGNIHTHSLWSDGNDFPEMIADWYRSGGYHFLALSDHNILSEGTRWMDHADIVKEGGADALQKYLQRFGDEWVETRGEPGMPNYQVRLKPLNEFRKLLEQPGRFLMIQSEEISDEAEGLPVHINATNVHGLIEPMGGRTVAETIDNNLRAIEDQSKRNGREMLGHLNHPNFGLAVTAEDMATVLRARFFEVYNGHPGVKHLGDLHHPKVEQMWDIANTIRLGELAAPPLFAVAVDDSHNYHGEKGSRPGRGWIMVRARELEPTVLIQAIKAGDFYASSGVTLDEVAYNQETKVHSLRIHPQADATYTTQYIGTKIGYDSSSKPRADADGKPLRASREYSKDVGEILATVVGESASYQLSGKELYVRAVVTSSKPHRDPSFKGQRQQAWTQPVGWRERLDKTSLRDTGGAGSR